MRRPTPSRNLVLALPSRRTVTVVALALLAAGLVWQVTARASDAAESLGTTTPAWVAESDLRPGDVIAAGDVTRRDRPVAFVPDDALDDDPIGLTVRSGIASGEVVVAERVAEHGTGPAALIPSGWRGVALTPFDAPPPLEAGNVVDVVVSLDPAFGSSEGGGVLVDAAVVVHVDESGSTITVAVPDSRVPAVAAAQMAGAVTLVLAG